jgi:hypothetical protein
LTPIEGIIDLDAAVEQCADRIISGKPIRKNVPNRGTAVMSESDQIRISRVLGTSIEVFNSKLAERLAVLSGKIAERVEEKIDNDEFKPGELGFIFSVMEDKRRALSASSQVGAAQVNIQVNHYGDRTKDQILADLRLPSANGHA